MAETIRAENRGKAMGAVQGAWAFGWGAAVVLYTVLFPGFPATSLALDVRDRTDPRSISGIRAPQYCQEPARAESDRTAHALGNASIALSLAKIFRPGTAPLCLARCWEPVPMAAITPS